MTMTSDWLDRVRRRVGASDSDLDEAERRLGVRLPEDYRALMRQVDGGDAEFGASWTVLWHVRDLAERNEGYQVAEFAPDFTYFGSDGGGDAYAWDWRAERPSLYTVIPFIGADPRVAMSCGDDFEAFLSTLFQGIPFRRGQ